MSGRALDQQRNGLKRMAHDVFRFELLADCWCKFLEPVYDLLSSNLRKAKWIICKLVFSFRSQFFHSRRHFPAREGPFYNPAFRQHDKRMQFIALDDLNRGLQLLHNAVCERLARVPPSTSTLSTNSRFDLHAR